MAFYNIVLFQDIVKDNFHTPSSEVLKFSLTNSARVIYMKVSQPGIKFLGRCLKSFTYGIRLIVATLCNR